MKKPKIAIIHDWLTGMRGGEKCLEVFCELFPDAALFTIIHKKGSMSETIENMDIRTSFLQKVPNIFKNYRWFLPIFPWAVENFDLAEYDIVLSSSHCAAKGAKKGEGALHICYCYTPMRYAWKFFDEYFSKEGRLKKWIISSIMRRLRKWDISSNKRIDYFIAISDNIKSRIHDCYGLESDVIYPPVEAGCEACEEKDEGFYLIVSALVPYKKVDLAVETFNKNGKKLIIIGDGDRMGSLKKVSDKNIEFLGWVSDKSLKAYYQKCRALVFPGEEDFGIVPVEAQSFGKPVIAYARGGVLETILPFDEGGDTDATGVFFKEQTCSSLNGAIELFEKNRDKFDPAKIRKNATRFSRERFKSEIKRYVEGKWERLKSEETRDEGRRTRDEG
ncbi:MAG: glycosyltransferase [Candidatus Omnitrophota bacterium]